MTAEACPSEDSLELSAGDFYPYETAGGSLTYGRVVEVDSSRDRPYNVSLDRLGTMWLSYANYVEEAPHKHIDAEQTAGDLYWRVSRYDGR